MARLAPNDMVWLTTDGKLRGICRAVEEAQRAGQAALIVAYFEDTLVQLENALRAWTLPFQRYALLYLSSLCQAKPGTIVTALAHNFTNISELAIEPVSGPALVVVIAEHYPLVANERDLLKTLTALPCTRRIDFHCTLTDPLMLRFGSSSVQKMARQLGLNDQTPLSSPLLGSAIHQAQTKISKKVYAEITARSAEEWFQLNLPA